MTSSRIYENFSKLKTLTLWAGAIGVIQSLIWIGLSVVGILSYQCVIEYTPQTTNFGTIVELTFYHLYFQGSCKPKGFPYADFSVIRNINTILSPEQIAIWTWVYLAVSIIWGLSSISLLTNVDIKHLKRTNILLYVWFFITLAICGMDLGLGIIFGLDYEKFHMEAYNYNLASNINAHAVVLVAAQISSITMMIMALKGFVMWIINVGFLAYFFKETFTINTILSSETSFIHNDYSNEIHSSINRSPIKAYETNAPPLANRPSSVVLNTQPLQRAARMSMENLEERHNRKSSPAYINYQQYPPVQLQRNEPAFPAPDYTPPMSRTNRFNSPLPKSIKNTRYNN